MAGNGLIALAAGFGGGYLKASDQADEKDRMDRRLKMDEESHGLAMDEANSKKALRTSLQEAGRERTVSKGANGMSLPDEMDARDIGSTGTAELPNGGLSLNAYKVAGKSYPTQQEADGAAALENSPDAVVARSAKALRSAGQPVAAIDLEQKQASIRSAQLERAKKMKEEGVIDAAHAARTGNPQAVMEAFNKSGTMKILSPPKVTPRTIDMPGYGPIQSYDYEAEVVGPDGVPKIQKINSHELGMMVMPYDKMLQVYNKGVETTSKVDEREARSEAALAKADAAVARAGAGGGKAADTAGSKQSEQDRKRITVLFQDAGRRQQDAEKSLRALQKEPSYRTAAPGSKQAAELDALKGRIKQYGDDRAKYQSQLATGKAPGDNPGLADSKPAIIPKANGKADFSALWKK